MPGPSPRLMSQLASPSQRPLPTFSPSEILSTVPQHYPAPRASTDHVRRRPLAPGSRPPRPSRSNRDEAAIGYVLANKKKFKCTDDECKELTFGRLADLRRHFDQNHSNIGEEYFCRHSGCPRSHAETGGTGRSFGMRKDKRDEHERMVHDAKRTRNSTSSEKRL
jgi:hypothetical protein